MLRIAQFLLVLSLAFSSLNHVWCAEDSYDDLLDVVPKNAFDYDAVDVDLQQGRISSNKQLPSSGRYTWDRYYRLDTVYDYLRNMSGKYKDKTTLLKIGETAEGRDILVFKIHDGGPSTKKPEIIMDAAIYGNNWLTTATATYIIDLLLTSTSNVIKRLASSYKWTIIPVLNPDGYEYSITTDPLWRKNRRRFPGSDCIGVDLNRNFIIGAKNESKSACTNTYKGPKPLSEKETAAWASTINGLRSDLRLYVSLQGFSQKVLYPYGYQKSAHIKKSDYEKIARETCKRLKSLHGTSYTYGSMYTALHESRGNVMDYAQDIGGMAFTLKLPPASDGTFKIPRRIPLWQISPTVRETSEGLWKMVEVMEQLGYLKTEAHSHLLPRDELY